MGTTGFLGTRADMLMDLVIVAFTIILPMLIFSWVSVRNRQYQHHKTIQLSLASILAIAVALFEINLKLSGGIFALTQDSAYAGTLLFNSIIYSHAIVAIMTTFTWATLITLSLKRFDQPPRPNRFSIVHRRWGRIGMMGMIFTGLSSYPLYYLGFVL